MSTLRTSNLFALGPEAGNSKGIERFKLPVLIVLFGMCFSKDSFAQEGCQWIATGNVPIKTIQKSVQEKSGKAPQLSCGAGADFKVCHSCEDRLTPDQWRKVQVMLAQSSYRKWHQGWHGSSTTDAIEKAELSSEKIAWTDLQGENFFFAHREMYRNVQANLAAMGLPCITPWTELPQQSEHNVWPNISALRARRVKEKCDAFGPDRQKKIDAYRKELAERQKEIGKEHRTKSEEIELIKDRTEAFSKRQNLWKDLEANQEKAKIEVLARHGLTAGMIAEFRDCPTAETVAEDNKKQKRLYDQAIEHTTPKFLTGSLGNLGHAIEDGWHGMLHSTYDTERSKDCEFRSNDPECDGMGSAYSSHVNIHFYKAHGLIDEYIEKWLKANNYETASIHCVKGDKKCYKWKGFYTGTMPDFVVGSGCVMDSKSAEDELTRHRSIKQIEKELNDRTPGAR